jgi:hypothetical protein
VTQELNFTQPKLALTELRIEWMITQSLKHNAKMLFMFFLTFRKDQDIVNEDHDKLSSSSMKTEFIKYMK